jgi:crossover junction endodeoxyribonuclease RusA
MMFVVKAEAAPQGSKKMVRLRGSGRTVLLESSRRVKWFRNVLAADARRLFAKPSDHPAIVTLVFRFSRPPSHFTAKGKLKKDAPAYPTRKSGDLDKLCRAALDALTGVAYHDDSQVIRLFATKEYGAESETEIRIGFEDGVDPYETIGYPPGH